MYLPLSGTNPLTGTENAVQLPLSSIPLSVHEVLAGISLAFSYVVFARYSNFTVSTGCSVFFFMLIGTVNFPVESLADTDIFPIVAFCGYET